MPKNWGKQIFSLGSFPEEGKISKKNCIYFKGRGESRERIFGGHKSSSWVEIRLHTKNQLPGYPGCARKVCGGVVGHRPNTIVTPT